MPIRCVYTDLDGTLLGHGGSLLQDADGGFTLLGVRGLEACARAGVEVVPISGRRRATVAEITRLLGQRSFVYEVGCGLVIDGDETVLTGDLRPRDGRSVYELIEESGAPRLLVEHYAGRLEYPEPWHEGREFTHLLRGLVDTSEADRLLAEHGHGELRLVDNGAIAPKPSLAQLPGPPHAYHLMPRAASKAAAVAAHMRARGLSAEACVAVGDSREDLEIASAVGSVWLVANAVANDPALRAQLAHHANARLAEAAHGPGVYEAVVTTRAERR